MPFINSAGAGGGSGTPSDGWVADVAYTFASAASFTVGTTDLTGTYTPGTRIKFTNPTVKFFVVVSSSFGAGTTTVTVTGGSDFTVANSAITLPFHSYAANPQGYPGWFAYAPAIVGWAATPTSECRFSVTGRTVFVKLHCTGTSNATGTTIGAPIAAVNSSNDPFMPCLITNSAAGAVGRCYMSSTTVFTFGVSATSDTWTNTGQKAVDVEAFYEI